MRANEFIIEYRKNAMVGGIDLSFEYDDKFGESARVQAFSNGRKLGYAEFLVVNDRELEATDLEVDERYRGQGIARLMYDFVKQQGYKIHRSHAQTTDGHAFWNKNRGEDADVWEDELSEISRDRLERYLSRAGHQVDTRQERMARARQRLNTSYEIYHADEPTKIVDRFEADTPADAQRYYQDYIERYESDRDYDLRLRRGTGIQENFAQIVEYSLFDLHHEFFEEINQLDISLFENKEDYLKLKNILKDFSTSTPTIGKKYVYTSVAATPAGKIMNIAHFTKPYQLIAIKDGRYYFNINGTQRVFPEQGRFDKQDSYQHIFMFDTVKNFEKMTGWININYSDDNQWKVSSKKLDENFADGKKPGRKGLSRRVGIPKKATLAQLQKIASSSTGERRRMAQWQLNMRRGKAKKAK